VWYEITNRLREFLYTGGSIGSPPRFGGNLTTHTRHAHGVVARHPPATRTTTKNTPASNDATTPMTLTGNGG
jgi:hypothetical protein